MLQVIDSSNKRSFLILDVVLVTDNSKQEFVRSMRAFVNKSNTAIWDFIHIHNTYIYLHIYVLTYIIHSNILCHNIH